MFLFRNSDMLCGALLWAALASTMPDKALSKREEVRWITGLSGGFRKN
jgi:hypothetical protein